MSELISKDIVDLQDIEKVQYLQTLQADPAQYSAYVNDKSNRVISEVVDTKRASFVKVSGDMARMMDMDHNSQAALIRTEELQGVQKYVVDQQTAQESAMRDNLQLTRRQVEINNWYYENKRETLFVLQMVLLVLLIVTLALGAAAIGFLGDTAANYIAGIAILIGAGVWVYRWYYTAYVRDPRWWNQRNFKGDGKFAWPQGEICIGSDGNTKPKGPTDS